MKLGLKQLAHILIQTILWMFGAFFILGSIAYLPQSLITGAVFMLLGILFIPPGWRFLVRRSPKLFTRSVRIIGVTALFVTALTISPDLEPQTQQIVDPNAVNITHKSSEKTIEYKPQKLAGITFESDKYVVSGTGISNTEYILKLSHGPDIKIATDVNGDFSQEIPESTQVFGSIDLSRDTNGAWPGGKKTYDTKYFILNSDKSALSDTLPKPVITKLSGDKIYEMSGYYLPGKKLLLKAEGTNLATTTVDKSGHYRFEDIALDTNYIKFAIYEKASRGWFSSKEEKLSGTKYFDVANFKVLNKLPVIVKEVISTESIPFSSRTVKSSNLNSGVTKVTQKGSSGEKKLTHKVTYRGNDEISRKLISSKVTKQPIEKITTVGTYVYVAPPLYTSPPPQPQRQQAPQASSGGRTGAICRDGTRSYATGRGACSHHGGVAQWLY